VIENSFEALSVHAWAIIQAIDAKDFKERLSPATRWIYDEISALAPPFADDAPAFEGLAKIKSWLMQTEVGAKMKKLLGW
jgi:histidine ammonia-lyase